MAEAVAAYRFIVEWTGGHLRDCRPGGMVVDWQFKTRLKAYFEIISN